MTFMALIAAKNQLNVVSYRYLDPLARYLQNTTIFLENLKKLQFSGEHCV
jgi:hypothetical protein